VYRLRTIRTAIKGEKVKHAGERPLRQHYVKFDRGDFPSRKKKVTKTGHGWLAGGIGSAVCSGGGRQLGKSYDPDIRVLEGGLSESSVRERGTDGIRVPKRWTIATGETRTFVFGKQ